jgi:hypothetical protein
MEQSDRGSLAIISNLDIGITGVGIWRQLQVLTGATNPEPCLTEPSLAYPFWVHRMLPLAMHLSAILKQLKFLTGATIA